LSGEQADHDEVNQEFI